MLVKGSGTIISRLGISDTIFGMTILAFLVSIEELAREPPAAMKGRPEISFWNVVGSILAFFLFNAGIIGHGPFFYGNFHIAGSSALGALGKDLGAVDGSTCEILYNHPGGYISFFCVRSVDLHHTCVGRRGF